ncbi:MAG: hypothetical protein IKA62_03375 [Clostridia bacterium]|nr:hypothetical protein [Clostridia bacterium]
MQLKRIFVSLLVAIMMLSLAVITAVAVDTASATFDVAVEVSSAVDAEAVTLVSAGDTIEVKVVIEKNPGAAYTQVTFFYDADVLTPVDADEDGSPDITQGGTYNYTSVTNTLIKGENAIVVISDISAKNSVALGDAFTIKFRVAENVNDNVKLEYVVKAYNEKNEKLADDTRVDMNLIATSHNVGADNVSVAAPTCTEDGKITITCADAGCDFVMVVDGDAALGHDMETVGEVAATCTVDGHSAGEKCSRCDETTCTVYPATGHTEVVVPGVAATCTTDGTKDGKKCSVCGETTLANEVAPATGHSIVTVAKVDATCTTAGSTEGTKCSTCGVYVVEPTVIQPLGHTEKVIPAEEPTYSEPGSTEGKECTVCGAITVQPVEIPALSLTWLWVLIAAVVVIGAGAVAVFFIVKKKK